MIWIVAVVVGGLVILFAIGTVVGRQEKKNAPLRLTEARAAWAEAKLGPAFKALEGVFHQTDGNYTAEDVPMISEGLQICTAMLASQGINAAPLTREVQAALTQGERAVPEKAVERLQKFLSSAAKSPDSLWSEVFSLDSQLVQVDTEDDSEGSNPADSAITNQVGKALVFDGPEKALQLIDQHLPSASPSLKASLLNQRGGCHAMARRREEAAADYRAAAALQPGNLDHWSNLIEMLLSLGNKAEAVQQLKVARSAATTDAQRGRLDSMQQWFLAA